MCLYKDPAFRFLCYFSFSMLFSALTVSFHLIPGYTALSFYFLGLIALLTFNLSCFKTYVFMASLALKSFSSCMLTVWICNDSPSFSSTYFINTIVTSELTHELFKCIFQVPKCLGFFLQPPGRLPMVPSTYATTVTTAMAMCCLLGENARKDTIYFYIELHKSLWGLALSLPLSGGKVEFHSTLESSRPPSIFLFLFPTFYSSSMESQRGKSAG